MPEESDGHQGSDREGGLNPPRRSPSRSTVGNDGLLSRARRPANGRPNSSSSRRESDVERERDVEPQQRRRPYDDASRRPQSPSRRRQDPDHEYERTNEPPRDHRSRQPRPPYGRDDDAWQPHASSRRHENGFERERDPERDYGARGSRQPRAPYDDGTWRPFSSWNDTRGGFTGRGRANRNVKSSRTGKQNAWWRLHARALIITLMIVIVVTTGGTVDALLRFNHDRALASDGMQHLRAAQALIPGGQVISALLDPAALPKLTTELTAAQQDFSALRSDLGAPGGTLFLAAHTPILGNTVSSAAMLAAAADEVCQAGIIMIHAVPPLQAYIRGGVFAKTAAPNAPPPVPLTAETLAALSTAWGTAKAHINNALDIAGNADLSAIPGSFISAKQLGQLRDLVSNRANTQKQLDLVDGWLNVLPQLLGVTAPEHFLLVLQDRSELRSTGGFMGNHAIITLQGGHIQPFHLEDTYLLDRPYAAQYGSQALPAGYSWWPFRPFEFRDSNLSADFPTSAQFEQKYFQIESGQSVAGIINITPTLVESILGITGGVKVPGYPDVVTSTNLETTIHKYQLGLLSNDPTQRKAFTSALGQAVLASVQKLTLAQQAHLVTQALSSIHTKDIQVWLANPKAEALLAASDSDNSIAHGAGDAVTPVDSNIGGNKANQFVTVKYTDLVTIDANGTATHHLSMEYDFHATSIIELYGPDDYHAYVRVYVPPTASLSRTKGFIFDYYSPNSFGPSDVPGHQMWAGHVVVQDSQPYTLGLVWTVPHAAQRDSANHWHYSVDFQRQGGSLQYLTLTVTMPGQTTPTLNYKGWLSTDKVFDVTG